MFFLSATTELQLSMLDGFSAVEELSAAEPVDEKALLNAIHEVLSAELRVKEAHMGLLVRVRTDRRHEHFSLAAMLIPTNDGFVAVRG